MLVYKSDLDEANSSVNVTNLTKDKEDAQAVIGAIQDFISTSKEELIGDSFDAIILEDKLTGEKVNLQTESYTFLHSKDNANDRFVLSFVNGQQTTDNSHFAYINNGELVITEISGDATINIYDIMGRDAINRVRTEGFVSGVYIIQKIDDKGINTQKILLNN